MKALRVPLSKCQGLPKGFLLTLSLSFAAVRLASHRCFTFAQSSRPPCNTARVSGTLRRQILANGLFAMARRMFDSFQPLCAYKALWNLPHVIQLTEFDSEGRRAVERGGQLAIVIGQSSAKGQYDLSRLVEILLPLAQSEETISERRR